ncbi:MAG TPA: hypothetical protein VN704_05830, partial [Verrucomicrobiae bacterium]|nr:hypothetical protein [Verrucomicrobiae bacterium]
MPINIVKVSATAVVGRNRQGVPSEFLTIPISIPIPTPPAPTVPLPIESGGTNSITSLTNGKIMISASGQIVEGTSNTDPSFQTMSLTNLPDESINNFLDSLLFIDNTGKVYQGSNYDTLVG